MKHKVMSGFPPREKALEDLFALWSPKQTVEWVPLDEACGRVTAESLTALYDLPVFRASMCDGIAVKSADFKSGIPDASHWKQGVEYVRADTGDDFPDEYDSVIEIENVELCPDGTIRIEPDYPFTKGCNIRPAGSTLRKGDPLISLGMPLRPMDLAALAMGGIGMVPVRKKPRIAFIPTGSELIPAGTRPARGQNIDTNSVLIKHSLIEMGAEAIVFPIVPDMPNLLEETLDRALSVADIVIINAGSAVGSEDFNSGLLGKKGEVVHHYIAAAPGRPMALCMVGDKPVIDLPGPTMAAYFGADWCLRALIDRYLGLPMLKRQTVRAVLTEDISSSPHMAILCRIALKKTPDGYKATPLSFHTMSMPLCLTTVGQYISPVGEQLCKAGDVIEVELLRTQEYIE